MGEISFVEYTIDFLNLSWTWLNDPEVKRLTNTPDISREIQVNWFDSLKGRSDYKVWGIKYEEQKIGVVGLKNINSETAEYFGYIGEKKYWNQGISKYMLDHACNYSKAKNLNSLWLRVIKENARAIKAYEKYGFKIYDDKNHELLMSLEIL